MPPFICPPDCCCFLPPVTASPSHGHLALLHGCPPLASFETPSHPPACPPATIPSDHSTLFTQCLLACFDSTLPLPSVTATPCGSTEGEQWPQPLRGRVVPMPPYCRGKSFFALAHITLSHHDVIRWLRCGASSLAVRSGGGRRRHAEAAKGRLLPSSVLFRHADRCL